MYVWKVAERVYSEPFLKILQRITMLKRLTENEMKMLLYLNGFFATSFRNWKTVFNLISDQIISFLRTFFFLADLLAAFTSICLKSWVQMIRKCLFIKMEFHLISRSINFNKCIMNKGYLVSDNKFRGRQMNLNYCFSTSDTFRD